MTPLHEHGIHTEDSFIRAHVGVNARSVYVFKTEDAKRAIHTYNFEQRKAYQPGVSVPTAMGWIAPIEMIDNVRVLKIPNWPLWDGFCETLSTSQKGAKAVDIVLALIERGRFPFWIKASESKDRKIQISGTDILVDNRTAIQVKCDFKAGPRSVPGCSGNLFLQSHEINPLGLF